MHGDAAKGEGTEMSQGKVGNNISDVIGRFQLESVDFPHSSVGKESACNAGDLGSIPTSGRSSGEGNGSPLQYTLPGESYGQRSLAGYSPWDHKSRKQLRE